MFWDCPHTTTQFKSHNSASHFHRHIQAVSVCCLRLFVSTPRLYPSLPHMAGSSRLEDILWLQLIQQIPVSSPLQSSENYPL